VADKSTIYRAGIQLSDSDREVYTDLKLTLACHPSETKERLLARLLAYALNYEEGIEFTKGICDGESPDLWLRDENSKIRHWIEVGMPDPERLERACRKSEKVTLYLYGRQVARWSAMHQQRLALLSNLDILLIDTPFLQGLVENLERNIQWSLTRSGGVLYLNRGEALFSAPLKQLPAPHQE
jgi:uncharacterized protein YaeQ